MIRRFFTTLFKTIYAWVQSPGRILIFCGISLFLGLVMDGTLVNLWLLEQEQKSLLKKMDRTQMAIADLDHKLKRAEDPQFIRLQAQDRFDLAGENELLFVFADVGEEESQDEIR